MGDIRSRWREAIVIALSLLFAGLAWNAARHFPSRRPS
jgi:hypothetical protein